MKWACFFDIDQTMCELYENIINTMNQKNSEYNAYFIGLKE